jgi:hypothetical protein
MFLSLRQVSSSWSVVLVGMGMDAVLESALDLDLEGQSNEQP